MRTRSKKGRDKKIKDYEKRNHRTRNLYYKAAAVQFADLISIFLDHLSDWHI